jgi:hypothetical protein
VNTYIAFYRGKQITVTADTALAAREKAATQFKAKKSYQVDVWLAAIEDGTAVIHSTTELPGA